MKKLKTYLHLLRFHQYLKNGFIWLPLFFGYKLHDPDSIINTIYAFGSFCFAASAVYVFNDLTDISEDRKHPAKKYRPLASGLISRIEAVVIMIVMLTPALLIPLNFLPDTVFIIICGYIIINIAYSSALKHRAIIDVVCIAIGFVLRIFAGGIASDVKLSPWIVIMTFLLALFLALAKRRDDLILSGNGQNVRKSLDGYNLEFVSLSMVVMASVIIVAYILYTVSPEVVEKHGTNYLYLTGFWVIIGIMRYMQITFVEQRSGSPTMVLLKDYVLQAIVILWLLNYFLLLYGYSFRG